MNHPGGKLVNNKVDAFINKHDIAAAKFTQKFNQTEALKTHASTIY